HVETVSKVRNCILPLKLTQARAIPVLPGDIHEAVRKSSQPMPARTRTATDWSTAAQRKERPLKTAIPPVVTPNHKIDCVSAETTRNCCRKRMEIQYITMPRPKTAADLANSRDTSWPSRHMQGSMQKAL